LPAASFTVHEHTHRENIMSIATQQDLSAYIAALELDDSRLPNTAPHPVRFDTTDSGYVDAGSLISFVAGVSAENRADILNSTLLAQLAANKQYNREQQTQEWYGMYREVL
jgi:hypothetical protein